MQIVRSLYATDHQTQKPSLADGFCVWGRSLVEARGAASGFGQTASRPFELRGHSRAARRARVSKPASLRDAYQAPNLDSPLSTHIHKN